MWPSQNQIASRPRGAQTHTLSKQSLTTDLQFVALLMNLRERKRKEGMHMVVAADERKKFERTRQQVGEDRRAACTGHFTSFFRHRYALKKTCERLRASWFQLTYFARNHSSTLTTSFSPSLPPEFVEVHHQRAFEGGHSHFPRPS